MSKKGLQFSSLSGSKNDGSRTELGNAGGTGEQGWGSAKQAVEKPSRGRRAKLVDDLLYLTSVSR